jgi:hypothetical protein
LGCEPLAFVAAWKILDVLMEYVLNRRLVPIIVRVKEARHKTVVVEPFASEPTLWWMILDAYAEAAEYRHAIIHREVTTINGDLICKTKSGMVLRAVTADEQIAFCRVAQRVAAAVVRTLLCPRSDETVLGSTPSSIPVVVNECRRP